MPRGKRTPPEDVYRIMLSWAETGNPAETARILKDAGIDVSVRTVQNIVNDNRDKPEFAQICAKKRKDFIESATEAIDKGLKLIDRRLTTALEHEEALEKLLTILETAPADSVGGDRAALIAKVRALQLQKLGEITTTVGILYDKRALARGENTENTQISFNLPDEIKDFAQ